MVDIAFICWNIWKGRSEYVNGRKPLFGEIIISRIKNAVYEYGGMRSNRVEDEYIRKNCRRNDRSEGGRVYLDTDWIKINCDDCYVASSGVASSGVVARDYRGLVINGSCRPFLASSAVMAEALALKEGVTLAIKGCYNKVILEIDCKKVYDLFAKKVAVDWRTWLVFVDIQKFIKEIPVFKLALVKRNENAVADWVPRSASKDMSWSAMCRLVPSSMVSIYDKDGVSAPPL